MIRTVSQLAPLSSVRPVGDGYPLSGLDHNDLFEMSLTGVPGEVFAPTEATSGYFNANGYASVKIRFMEMMAATSAEYFTSTDSLVLSTLLLEISAHLFSDKVASSAGNFTNDGYIKINYARAERWIPIYSKS